MRTPVSVFIVPLCLLAGAPRPAAPTAVALPAQEIAVHGLITIGCGGCPAPGGEFAPQDVAIHDGFVWLLDKFPPFVRAFDMDGAPVLSFVGEGEGPGETQMPFAIHHTSTGNVLVHGALPAALLTVDGTTGKHISRVPLELRVPLDDAYHGPTGMLYVLSFRFGERGRRVDRIDTTSGEGVTIIDVGTEEFPGEEEAVLEQRARLAMAVLPSGELLLGRARDYAVTRYSPAGIPLGTFGRDLPRPLAADTGDELPHFDRRGIEVDGPGNRVWVRTLRGNLAAETIFDVFTGAGDYLGQVTIPTPSDRFYPNFAVGNDLLVTIYELDDGIEVLALWRVDWP